MAHVLCRYVVMGNAVSWDSSLGIIVSLVDGQESGEGGGGALTGATGLLFCWVLGKASLTVSVKEGSGSVKSCWWRVMSEKCWLLVEGNVGKVPR